MRKRDRRLAILLLLPVVIILGLVVVIPVGYNFWLSVHEKEALSPTVTYVGLSNFIKIVQSSTFWSSFVTGTVWALTTVILQIILGLGIALLLNQQIVAKNVIRALVLLPYAVPPVVVALVWRWMLNDINGIINHILVQVGIIGSPIPWLAMMGRTLWVVIFIGFWKYVPFVVIALLARLQAIDPNLYEAAIVDGASSWQKFIYITLPQLREIFFVVILLRAIWMFNKFDILWLLTKGGPGTDTQTLPLYAYWLGFSTFRMGLAATACTMIFLILVAGALVYFRVYKLEEGI